MTSNKGWLADWEEETEERRPAPPSCPRLGAPCPTPAECAARCVHAYTAGTTTNPAETARLAYRKKAPAECAHAAAPATSPAVCPDCGLVLS